MADSGDILNQQHLCRMFSSKFSGVNRLEMSPFLAVMRSLKVEYGQTQPEVFKMLLSILHDYNPCLGQAHFDMTARYISLLLERHPEFAEYIISILPPVPGNNTSTSPHSLHILRDDVTTMRDDVMAGRNDFTVCKEASMVKKPVQEGHPGAKRMRVKDGNIKFYNYTPPSVNAYVASQGIPQRIVSNKPQPVAIPAMVTLATSTQVTLVSSVVPSTAVTVASPFIPIPSGGGVLLRPLVGGESVGGLRVGAPSRVVGAHCQTALLLSTRCPTLIAPRNSHMSLASIVNPCKVSASGLTPKPAADLRKAVYRSQTAPKSSVITHMSGTTPVNASVTVAIGRPSSLKFKASSLERNTASFPYSQQIVVNQRAKVKHTSGGQPESTVPVSEKVLPAIVAQKSKAASSDALRSGKFSVEHNCGPIPTFTAFHSLSYPGTQSANEMVAGASGESDLRQKPKVLDIPELAGSLHVEPLDLSTMARMHDPTTELSKQVVGRWVEEDLEEFSTSEPNRQEDYDSQGTDAISVGGNSPPTATTTTADELSSEDPESDTFLAQMLKLPTPPDYSSSWAVAPNKEKKKPKTRYYTGKRKRPMRQTKKEISGEPNGNLIM